MSADPHQPDQPVVPFHPPPSPRTPDDSARDLFNETLALEITHDVQARLPTVFGDDALPPLVAAFAGFGAARLLPSDALAAALAGDPPIPTAALPWPSDYVVREAPSDTDLRAVVEGFRRGAYVGDPWAVDRELERQHDYVLGVSQAGIRCLGDQVPDAVLDWLDPRLAATLDGPEVQRLRARNLLAEAHEASLTGIRRVTQGYRINRSLEQWFSAARKERQRVLAPSADDAFGEALLADLTSAYAAWLARETPPLGVALLVAARIATLAGELRGVAPELFAYHASVLVPCRDYLGQRVALDDWYACGRAGLAAWPPDTARYWAEGLAALVPSLSAARSEARRAPSTVGHGDSEGAVARGGADTAPPAGASLKRWQERLRTQVHELTKKVRELEATHAAALAKLRADHARALAAGEEERQELHRRLVQGEQATAAATASLRRVERDAQLAMRRVAQLEEALEAQGGVAPTLEMMQAPEGEGDADGVPAGSKGGGDAGSLPVDCFAGHRVFVFTGNLRQGIHEHMAASFRQLGAADVDVRLSHRDHGPPVFRGEDCVVIDLTFAAHADTEAIRAKAMAAGAWVHQAKRGPATLADAAGRAWLEWRERGG